MEPEFVPPIHSMNRSEVTAIVWLGTLVLSVWFLILVSGGMDVIFNTFIVIWLSVMVKSTVRRYLLWRAITNFRKELE